MSFRLRYQHQDTELESGDYIIGRSSECQIVLEDPLVSRQHARLRAEPERVTIEDLNSRNGVSVNSERISQPTRLDHGDRIGIGNQELLFLSRRDARADTLSQQAPTDRLESFTVMAGLADKAIALGRADDALRVLSPHLEHAMVSLAEGRDPGDGVIEAVSVYACKLAALSGKARWIEYVFEVHSLRGSVCSATVVDSLYKAIHKVKGVSPDAVRNYVSSIRAGVSTLPPSERFLLNRVEGLIRLVEAR